MLVGEKKIPLHFGVKSSKITNWTFSKLWVRHDNFSSFQNTAGKIAVSYFIVILINERRDSNFSKYLTSVMVKHLDWDIRHFGSKISSILQRLAAAAAIQVTTKTKWPFLLGIKVTVEVTSLTLIIGRVFIPHEFSESYDSKFMAKVKVLSTAKDTDRPKIYAPEFHPGDIKGWMKFNIDHIYFIFKIVNISHI